MEWQHFSEEVMKFLYGWEVQALVLLSLVLQIILIIFGSWRKSTRIIWINLLVWLAYLIADWVATLALGTLARGRGDSGPNSLQSHNVLHAFWAPFLLLHLGGPDTITAYSLEDNELWLRHFLELVVQVGVAFYIYIPSWNNNNTALTYIAIPVFITGIIKYVERTLVLWSSSAKQLKDSLRSSNDHPGPDLALIMEREKPKAKRLMDSPESIMDEEVVEPMALAYVSHHERIIKNVEGEDLAKAYLLFGRFKCLYAGLILDQHEREKSYSLITYEKSAEYAFDLVAIELGFMYDVLYTKASTIYSRFGIFLRCINFFSHVSASVAFSLIIDRHAFSPIDIWITYVLLLGAVFLEVYAFIMFLFSDWAKLWLSQRKLFCSGMLWNSCRRWSGSMGQYNLLSFCLAEISSKTSRLQKLFGIKELLEKYRYLTWKDVDVDLQEMIFKQVLEKGNKIKGGLFNIKLCKELLAQRGDYVLSKRPRYEEFLWSTIEVEFDHSLLLWHIATDLCYYDDFGGQENVSELPLGCKIGKCISNYMLYLLVVCPTMLPKGIGEIRYRQTCAEAMKFFKRKRFGASTEISEACKTLLQVEINPSLLEKSKDRSVSVLFYACWLAKQLQAFQFPVGDVINNKNNIEQKWGLISEVWLEMMAYAANHCGWKEHGQRLMKGGELITHVCLLMAHLGLSEQYQIQRQDIIPHLNPHLIVTPHRREQLRRNRTFARVML